MSALNVFSIIPTPIQFSFVMNKNLEPGTIIGQFQVLANRAMVLADLNNVVNVDWGDGNSQVLPTSFFQIQSATSPGAAANPDPATVVISIPIGFNKLYTEPINYNVHFIIRLGNQIIDAASQAIIRCPLFIDANLVPISPGNNTIPADTSIVSFIVDTLVPIGLIVNKTDSSYNALIDWGDNSPLSLGVAKLVLINSNPLELKYDIVCLYDHTYFKADLYTIQVKITNSDGEIISISNEVRISDITNLPKVIIPEPVTFKGVEGNALTGPNLPFFLGTVIGQFSIESDNSPINVNDFFSLLGSINVDWGDGSNTNLIPANVTSNGTGNKTVFIILANDVNSQHTYVESGKYNVLITVKMFKQGQYDLTTTIASFAEIVDAEITVVSVGLPPQVTNVLLADTILVTFSDLNPGSTVSDFYAMIDWGDSSPMNLGKIEKINNTQYTVSYPYQHIYPTSVNPVTYYLRIVIYDVDGEKAIANPTIALSGSTPNCCGSGGNTNTLSGYDVRLYSIVGCAKQNIFITAVITDLSGNTFPVDPNYLNVTTINWGDGHKTIHDIIPVQINNTSQYIIRHVHKYCDCGVYNVTITFKGVPSIAQVTIRECNKCNHNC